MRTRKSHLITSFSVEDSPENRQLLKELEQLAAKDGWSLSHLIREAVLEYAKRHYPGNPQLILGHWTSNIPLPETLRSHTWKQMRTIEDQQGAAWLCVDENCREGWFQP